MMVTAGVASHRAPGPSKDERVASLGVVGAGYRVKGGEGDAAPGDH